MYTSDQWRASSGAFARFPMLLIPSLHHTMWLEFSRELEIRH
jgi:hypothetical protein